MAAKIDYNIEDFTEENYRRLLNIAKSNNTICNFMEAIDAERGIVLRHDIDFSVHRAFALSEIEKDEGVQSTYFVYLHSQFYNALEREVTDLLKKIIQNGSLIGLHFEPGYYDLDINEKERLMSKIMMEKEILENILEVNISVISFHNPDVGGDWYKANDLWFGDTLNVYSSYFRENFEYCSDSNGYWRFQRLEDVLLHSKDKKIQILTHPGWWQKKAMYPYDRVKRCVEGRRQHNLELYTNALERSKRLNIRGE